MTISSSPLQQTTPLTVGAELRMALLVKGRDAQKAEGRAALSLIESCSLPPASDPQRGNLVDRYA